MKNYTRTQVLLLALVLIAGCKKNDKNVVNHTILTEEFASVYSLPGKDWYFFTNNSPNAAAQWTQGNSNPKAGPPVFDAWSYKNTPDEYTYINGDYNYLPAPVEISSWMITPSVLVKNGDEVQFYARSLGQPVTVDRLQLLLNETSDSHEVGYTPVSVGEFTKILFDINSNLVPGAFPSVWTKYNMQISGLTGTMKTRLAFRYVVDGLKASGIGVDAFTITRK
ncbi:MAG: choice-of-anchor J domain-containing protein [Ferruginibacter sp.]